MHLLEVNELRVSFNTPGGVLEAVRGLSFQVDKGQTLGIVGESGAGKSVAMQAMLGLLDDATVSGSALFEGEDLVSRSTKQMQGVLGHEVAMVFQDPSSSLHPLYRVGWQIEETTQRSHADVIALFRQPHHPYTRGLIESLPEQGPGDQRLRTISGQPPSMVKIPSGCAFHPRCKYVMDICKIREPPLEGFAGAAGHFSALVLWLYRPTQAPGAATSSATSGGRSPFAMFSRLTPSSTPRILARRAIHTSCRCWAAPSYLTVSGLRPRTCARGPSSARMTSATVTSDAGLPRLYPASRPRWLTSIPARRKSFKMTPRNLLGICWSAAMASTVMGSEAVAKTSNARTP